MLGDLVADVASDGSAVDDELAFEIHRGFNYSAGVSGGDNSRQAI